MNTVHCPHCGQEVLFLPDTRGNTIVADAESKPFVVVYPSGFCKKYDEGHEIHRCEKTGRDGHVVR